MAINAFDEKQLQERKREKRLVHLTNEIARDFAAGIKTKIKAEREHINYLVKSYLDYVFFTRHQEISETDPETIRHFLLEFAPRKMILEPADAKGLPDTLTSLYEFLGAASFVKTPAPIQKSIKALGREFAKLVPAKRKPAPRTGTASAKAVAAPTVGRNDPCPCGSGKKYKKCCGRN